MTYNADYAAFYAERTINSPYTQYKYDQLGYSLDATESHTVLDIGCNINLIHPNGLRQRLGRAGIDYFGIDVSSAYFAGATEPIPAVVGDAATLPFADRSFDAVIAGDVLEHIPPLEEVTSEMARVLGPGGRGLIVVPQLYKLDMFNLPEVRSIRPSSHVHFMPRSGWRAVVEAAGLTLDETQSRGLGSLSGLLYLAWTNPAFITTDTSLTSAEQTIFSTAKKEASVIDPQADTLIQTDASVAKTVAAHLQAGQFTEAINFLNKEAGGQGSESVMELCDRYATSLQANTKSLQHLLGRVIRSSALQEMVTAPRFIGNSVLLNFVKD